MIIVHSNIVTGCTRRKLLWKLFEQWHEKQFVGEMHGLEKEKRCMGGDFGSKRDW